MRSSLAAGAQMYDLTDVAVTYGDTEVIRSLTISLGPSPVAIMGPSGSGKSTLMRVLAGQQEAGGVIDLNGRPLDRYSLRRGGDARVALVHQDYRLVEFMSIVENVLLAAECRDVGLTHDDALDLLGEVGLDHLEPGRLPQTLSGGEQQRVAIARSVAARPEVLLADEPTGALDAGTTDAIADLLIRLAARTGMLLIVATHDERVAQKMSVDLHLQAGELRPR